MDIIDKFEGHNYLVKSHILIYYWC